MTIYFSLGTNLGDKEQNLRIAVRKIEEQIGEVISLSAFYATAPWGFTSDNTFLNAALCVEVYRRLSGACPDAGTDTCSDTSSDSAVCPDTNVCPDAEACLFKILRLTQEMEREMGRTHKSVNAVYSDRMIDIDLLLCFADDGTPVLLDTPELKLPHPLMQERDFVMRPLAEIAPEAAASI